MKGCQIGQSKLSIRKASEGIGKETKERTEVKAQADQKECSDQRDSRACRESRSDSGQGGVKQRDQHPYGLVSLFTES